MNLQMRSRCLSQLRLTFKHSEGGTNLGQASLLQVLAAKWLPTTKPPALTRLTHDRRLHPLAHTYQVGIPVYAYLLFRRVPEHQESNNSRCPSGSFSRAAISMSCSIPESSLLAGAYAIHQSSLVTQSWSHRVVVPHRILFVWLGDNETRFPRICSERTVCCYGSAAHLGCA
jgi:hypothetical protein